MTPEELEAQLQATRAQVEKVGGESRRLRDRPRSLYVSTPLEVKAEVSSLRRTITPPAGGTPSGTYTATHYVAPFASVSGAVNDYTDLGATSWTNAGSSGTPTTLGTAMARAVAGNNVRVAPGVYNGQATNNRFNPSFRPTNAGTLGNPIVFFAQYPAAYNQGQTTLYSELRKPTAMTTVNGFPVPDSTSPNAPCPVLGSNAGKHYVIYDGFYANESLALAANNGGVFLMQGCTGVEYRRCFIERGLGVIYYQAGANGVSFYQEGTVNCKILDCAMSGYAVRATIPVSNTSHPTCELYNSTGFVMRNCDFQNFGVAVYQKESDNQWTTDATWEYNKLTNGIYALGVQQGTCTFKYNLIKGANVSIWGDGGPVTYTGGVRPPQRYTFENNTAIMTSATFISAPTVKRGMLIERGQQIRTPTYGRLNIFYAESGWTGAHFGVEPGGSSSWTWADWSDLSSNCYYHAGGSALTFIDLDLTTKTGIAQWRTATGHEADSITSDPLFVSSSNYRLQGGSPAAGMGCYVTGTEEIGLRADPTY